ncbi:MAG TPA: MerR family transcriptional regulator [Rhizomicrobium sp.]|jgi:DNA-binding transcriptional MerR regulator|nr:MerR family transcriptional regulator [Rhizomicrobium sp.]
MAATEERRLSPAEVTRRLGVSAKALRLYETRGLVKPLRTETGWRTYGAPEITRLHHILALKDLGLPLAQIEQLLSRRAVSLERVLAVQEDALAREETRVNHALALVRAARGKLAAGHALSIDDLIQLTRETTMTTRDETMKTVFSPLIEKHFTEAERSELASRSYDQMEAARVWDELIGEAKKLMAKSDPVSAEAKDLARRWMAQMRLFSQGDAGLEAKVTAVWSEALADPAAAPKLPITPEIFAFIGKAWKAAEVDIA